MSHGSRREEADIRAESGATGGGGDYSCATRTYNRSLCPRNWIRAVPNELATIIDFIRWGASRFNEAGLTFGHSYDNALDEATHLVLHALHLPPDLSPAYGNARLTAEERATVFHLFKRRIEERRPAAYLTGEAWFAGLSFKVDERVLVPRSPIAELITAGFEPWLGGREVRHALDLCTGSGCIAIAMAVHHPSWRVDAVDVSEHALELARENARALHADARMRIIRSDLFAALGDARYQLIVSNPPYVPDADVDVLPTEYGHEPSLGLKGGADGLDLALRIMERTPEHLDDDGLLVVEVGDSESALAGLLPQVPFAWIEFKVGQMGVFALERPDLVAHRGAIRAELARRGLT
jgi:ribosomal protein L3 glutamine methyltransferase